MMQKQLSGSTKIPSIRLFCISHKLDSVSSPQWQSLFASPWTWFRV